MNTKIPFVAFGNDELKKASRLRIGDSIACSKCKKRNIVSGAKNESGEEDDLLLFYKCRGESYLAGVHGKNVMWKFK
jgi:hypothetical protein